VDEMRTATKKIKRSTYESAAAAMVKHQQIMTIRGWRIVSEFGGNAGFKYEFITVFAKQ